MAYGKIKADSIIYDNSGSDVEKTIASLAAAAPTNNPTFTGTVTIPTPSAGDDSTKAASTAYVVNEFSTKASPTFTGTVTIPTPTAGDNSTKAASTAFVVTSFATKASPTFTGTVTIPTASANDSSTKAASTAFVMTELADYAPLAAPAFTGNATGANLTLSGNLTVNGTTTTVATTNTTVTDNLLELNSGASSNANDAGILIERGSTGDNAIIAWDESNDTFKIGTTTSTNTATGDLTISTGTLVAALIGDVTGNASGSSGSCTGNAATATTATNISANANNGNDETVYPTFIDGVTGSQGIETDSGLTYNPSSGLLTSTGFAGALTGNVTGNCSGSSGSCTGNAATATSATNAGGITGTPDITVDDITAASLDISGDADIDGTLEADAYTVNGTALNEYIADTVGAMVGSNTESGITVTYEDGDNTLDFSVGTLNQNTSGTAGGLSGSPNITVGTIGCGAITGTAGVSDSKGNLRTIPQLSKSSAHTIVSSDSGKHSINSSGGWVFNTSTGFGAGEAITLINNSGSDQTVTNTGATMYLAGDTSAKSSLTLSGRGVATFICTASNVYYGSGAGLA